MVRDAMLAVSGALDPTARRAELPRLHGRQGRRARPRSSTCRSTRSAPSFDRRTLYRTWARGGRSALLDAFDCPDPSTDRPAPGRHHDAAPGPGAAEQRPDRSAWPTPSPTACAARRAPDAGRQVDRAYRLAFGRPPDADERAGPPRVVERHGAGRRSPGRSSTATNSSTSIEPSRDGRRPPWTVASSSPGSATAWPAPRRPALMLRDGTLRAAVPGEAEPACPHFAPKADPRHPHLPRAAR